MTRYVNASNNDDGNPILIAQGIFPGKRVVNKFGRNIDIDTGTVPEDVWNGGGVYTGFPLSTTETLEVFSSDANDTAAGTGARTLQLYGLNGDGVEITETVTLNGLTPVLTTQTFFRMNRAIVRSSGSNNQAVNIGALTVRQSSSGAVMAVLPIGTNQTQIACYTIPAGYVGYIENVDVELNRSTSAALVGSIWLRESGGCPRLTRQFSAGQTSPFDKEIFGGLPVPALTDIAIRITSVTTNNVDVTAYFDLLLERD